MTEDTVSCAVYCRAIPAPCSGRKGDLLGRVAILPSSPLPEGGKWTLIDIVVIDLGKPRDLLGNDQRGWKQSESTMNRFLLHDDMLCGFAASVSPAGRVAKVA